MRDTDRSALRHHRRAQVVQVSGAAAIVDIEAVRLGVQRYDVSTGPAVGLRSDDGSRAIGAVDHHANPVQRVRGRQQQVIHIASGGLRNITHPADPGSGGTLPLAAVHPDGDLVLHRVGKFVAAGGEELDAVVRHRVV